MQTTQAGSNAAGQPEEAPPEAALTADAGAMLHELAAVQPPSSDRAGGRGREAVAVDYVALARQALRGRYAAFVLLGIIGAALGAYVGWRMGRPDYRSYGLVHIAYVTPPAIQITDQNMPLAMYDTYMRTQEKVVTSRRVLEVALKDPEWVALGRGGDSPADMQDFASELVAQRVGGTEHMAIAYVDPDPVAAAAAVRSVVRAFVKVFQENDAQFQRHRLAVIGEHETRLRTRLAELDQKTQEISRGLGLSNIDEGYNLTVQRLALLEGKLVDVQLAIGMSTSSATQPSGAPASSPAPGVAAPQPAKSLSLADIIARDPQTRELVNERGRIKRELDDATLINGYGESHQLVQRLRRLLQHADERVEQSANLFRNLDNVLARVPDAGGGANAVATLAQRPASVLREDEAMITKLRDAVKAEIGQYTKAREEILPLRAEAEGIRQELAAVKLRRDALQVESAVSGRVEVVSEGEVPLTVYYDIRKKYAAAGAALGGGLPAGLVLLFGLLHRRYRFSDEAEAELARTAPLLGIVPMLPPKLSDAEQASSTSQCLHQIRMLLQVGGSRRRRGVYLITSATPGEGKTSVCVGLGLSFAASGSRTLVIDCDLIAQRLTRGFGCEGLPGLRDALASGSVRGFARKTASGVWVLPVGTADALDACAVSSADMRRLLDNARRYFETIIIDSGPILGSVEATAVAPHVDGVVFVVSRGQQPANVERGLKHLDSIGADVAGFVFNRARRRDFSRSAHASSLRSISSDTVPVRNFTSDAYSRFGPLVQCVVSLLPTARDQSEGETAERAGRETAEAVVSDGEPVAVGAGV
jgi:Mrp family chromosome partitioning ATPase/uncharacterized protein involved in exopolysaccharide biosynthesis